MAGLSQQVRRAVKRRAGIVHDVRRLVDGAGDDVPGLFVDVYGEVARIELHDVRWRASIRDIVTGLGPAVPEGLVLLVRKKRGQADVDIVRGHVPRGVVVTESGVRLFVRPREADAAGAGVFADLREGRAFLRARARGGPHLNLFAHAGASGAAAFVGGATRVDHVDMSKKCAGWAATNLALNGAFPRAHRFIVDDALKVLRRAEKRGPVYQTICCDPPTTALRPSGQRMVARDVMHTLARQCLAALLPGGAMSLSCNDRSLDAETLMEAVRSAADEVGRAVKTLAPLRLGPDFTATGAAANTRGALVQLARR